MLRSVQWNIGGGKIHAEGAEEGAYTEDGLAYIIEILKSLNPDIIMLQETHANDPLIQAEQIAKGLGFSFWLNDVYDRSHLEEGQGLGQAILSKFPLHDHVFQFFMNPGWRRVWEDRHEDGAHNKGATTCLVDLPDGVVLQAKTCHSVPCRKFGKDAFSEEVASLRESMSTLCRPTHFPSLLLGDFNYNAPGISKFLPGIFTEGVDEVLIQEPTTPKGRTYDHVVYGGLKHLKTSVISSVRTDHYPVVSEFGLE